MLCTCMLHCSSRLALMIIIYLFITYAHAIGGVSMTLRHRLLCTVQTDHEVKTSSTDTDLCPISPPHNSPAKFDLGKLRIPESSECVPSMLVSEVIICSCMSNGTYTLCGNMICI